MIKINEIKVKEGYGEKNKFYCWSSLIKNKN